jgi:type IV pilus assembly protein PilC
MNGLFEFLAALFWYVVLFLLPVGWFAVFVHYLYSLPMRRRERALFFLHLIETALSRGQTAEHAIISAAETRDRMMGVQFFIVAAHIENGSRLAEALQKAPDFLTLQVSHILRAGERLGDLKSVLPACRETLRNASDQVRSAVHYMVTLLLVFSPLAVLVVWYLAVFVIPRFKEVANGMNAELWPVTKFVFAFTPEFVAFEVCFFVLLEIAAVIYTGGPRVVRWFQFRGLPIVDWIAWRMPWKQKRLQRTFSAMLAVLLDGGVPEAEAVRLAGDCTANKICHRLASRIVASIQQGTKLDDAVRAFDDSGEFHWRLTNATHASGGFLNALRGWHEALDAKAFQQEEATAHIVTSGLVILNGVLVALIATAMFGILIAILNGALLQ